MAGENRVASFHRPETQEANLLLSRQILSAWRQPGKDPAIVIGEIVNILAALEEVRIPVHEEFAWLHFVDNLLPGYEFIKNFNCRGWGDEAVFCPSKVPTPKENGDKEKKDESAVMAVNQEPDFEVTAETKLDKTDGGGTTSFTSAEIEKHVPPVGELPPETTVEIWIGDNGCSQFMTPSADYMVNYREGGVVVRIADGRAMPIEGIGNLPMSFWSAKD